MANKLDEILRWAIPIIVCLAIGALLLRCGADNHTNEFNDDNVETVIKYVVDTVVVIDTIERVKPVYKTKTVIDTLYLPDTAKNGFNLPITQKYYKEPEYELWISGYEPQLDRILVFPKTEYRYITKEVTNTKTISNSQYALYANFSVVGWKGGVIPKMSLDLLTPSKVSIRAGVGYFEKNTVFEVGVGYKLL